MWRPLTGVRGPHARCLKTHMLPAIAELASEEQLRKFNAGWCPKCIGFCTCKACMTRPVTRPSLALHGPQQQCAFARHTLHWIAPEVQRLHEAKVAEVCSSSPCCSVALLGAAQTGPWQRPGCMRQVSLHAASLDMLRWSPACFHACKQHCLLAKWQPGSVLAPALTGLLLPASGSGSQYCFDCAAQARMAGKCLHSMPAAKRHEAERELCDRCGVTIADLVWGSRECHQDEQQSFCFSCAEEMRHDMAAPQVHPMCLSSRMTCHVDVAAYVDLV